MAQITTNKTPIVSADNEPEIIEINSIVDVVLGIVNSGVNNGSKRFEFIMISKGTRREVVLTDY